MRKILITGGAGNIGSSLADRLSLDDNNEIVLVDNLLTGDPLKIPSNRSNITFIKSDVNNYSDISAIMLCQKFDYVFHYAAVVGVKRTIDNPKMVLNDIEGIKNILDLSKNTSIKKVFYSSSSEVYGEPVEIPQYEDTTPLNSRLPYAIVKNVGEAFFRTYHLEYGLNYTIFRFFNTYGPRQSTDFVISKFISQAQQNRDITIYGDGLQTRTFCYIDDNLETTEKILNQSNLDNEVINIGSDQEITILELAQKVIKLLNSKSKIIHLDPLKEGDMTRRKPDISKMKVVLTRALTSIDEGIMLTAKSGFLQ
ncbi:MAG: epimerase [Bacteroidetes bacterium GWA2_40_15]|nr:MAG: epimerase [Bacteroidetes bacterium GWA2_40_15]